MGERIRQIQVGDITLNTKRNIYMAGVCAIETQEQTFSTAAHVVKEGAQVLRGGVFKPRKDPKTFRGLGEDGLEIAFEAGRQNGIPIVTEVMTIDQIGMIRRASRGHPYILQIGSRNALNYSLLEAVGETGTPVLLKRGMGAKVQEMILAAEYVTKGGSPVIMCERGIVTFSDVGRYTADLLAVIKFQQEGFLTVFDPSHPAGRNDMVIPLALAGIGIGANGLIVEVKPTEFKAKCDNDQALSFDQFSELMLKARQIEKVIKGGMVR
ncbi:MAG: Phospho-2-dehydro-3-deoxyheptonate aldolase [Candidatus Roizmanbacteria bacterium GW2011_GWC2_37_13]|uniref:Phospho-2-dehydro-3-deoxyheptonate aldolase n=1 Tax=Candidatus Roizmanbacteria bacterium GW2011_GWC2_37_13 TaxID=1618486 RepID=A0A0G0G1W4_9BACT|nr:MAG: Phospho-2-dehydro-3-deoxyheptonate aldolase [Candidatus Roizmanbacteria bacterium GW2011_GWC1_37_12]KKQ25148.1 MAG: Phospho-2-dehydro-3-deoxyheptonate aldolase [Candidatus Roizmanbacteria bacterium GW2011_GWC2_37_13]